ncbi:MAG: hypothetical protein AB1813_00280 [Verrucomicrobiota bacterium]
MRARILLSGLLGGVALFFWGAIAHMALPLGEIGIQNLPAEEEVLAPMRQHMQQPGFYFFPGMDRTPGLSKEQKAQNQKTWEEKYNRGPHGILIYHPSGSQPLSAKQLVTEFITNVVTALLSMFFLVRVAPAFGARVGASIVLGLVVAIASEVPYWNWYGFPADYMMAQLIETTVGFAAIGIVFALVNRPNSAAPQALG